MSQTGRVEPAPRPRGAAVAAQLVLTVGTMIAGTILGIAAFKGGLKPVLLTAPLAPTPITATPQIPSPASAPSFDTGVLIGESNSEMIPGSDPCNQELRFHWTIDPSSRSQVPIGTLARIKAGGPGLAPIYTRPVTSGGIELRVTVRIRSSSAEWTADVVLIGARRSSVPTPLTLSFSGRIC